VDGNIGRRILLTGATGFVGRHLYPELARAGYDVVCASRHPDEAQQRYPDRRWIRMDLADPASIRDAMKGCDAAFYLVHGMAGPGDYEREEREAATRFVDAAREVPLKRIVYLGGVAPAGSLSRHLRSRLSTGKILRSGGVPVVELQAGMIIGLESESWRIVRDLSVRLPVMVLPRWLRTRSQPVAIEDVVAALSHALEIPADAVGCYGLPGPEILAARDILVRIARLRGTRPLTIEVPLVTPVLSSYWIQLVTRADRKIARELVQGLTSDLLAPDEGFWKFMPGYRRLTFDEAALRTLAAERTELSFSTRIVEALIKRISARATERPT